MKIFYKISTLFCIFTLLNAEPVKTTLEDYAYDYAKIGYEIGFNATSSYFIPMDSDSYFNANDGTFTIEVRLDGLSRNSKREFVPFYNENCEMKFDGPDCQLYIEGEIELDSNMKMILKANKINFLTQNDKKISKTFK
tara:strand:+ start:327 stop:740 length:414 start_codon:yes stop_codon:yes gene_type:complete